MSVRLLPLLGMAAAGAVLATAGGIKVSGLGLFDHDRVKVIADGGSATARDYKVGAFSKLDVSGPYEVRVVSTGQAGTVRATGGANVLDQTEVLVEDGALVIRPRRSHGVNLRFGDVEKVRVTIVAPDLEGAAIAGSGDVTVEKVARDFEGSVAGSGKLALPAITGGRMDFGIAGSGDIVAAGRADSIEASIAGSGDVDAAGLTTRRADVSIAGSGNVAANASDTAEVSIMGSGDVTIRGGARCKIDKTGSGKVDCAPAS